MVNRRRWERASALGLFLAAVTTGVAAAGDLPALFRRGDHGHPPQYTVDQLAQVVGDLDRNVVQHGTIEVKAPDVWGQARLTKSRREYELILGAEANRFRWTLNAADSRRIETDAQAGVTAIGPAASTTSQVRGATAVADPGRLIRRAADTKAPVDPKMAVAIPAGTPPAASPAAAPPANAVAVLDALGPEPSTRLDELSAYLNHLDGLRRINAGDDLSDLPGYGLYLVRTPISLFPNPNANQVAASVTITAEPVLNDSVLPSVFRDVVINDSTYQLKGLIDRGVDTRKMVASLPPLPRSGEPEGPDAGTRRTGNATRSGMDESSSVILYTELVELFGEDGVRLVIDVFMRNHADADLNSAGLVQWLRGELSGAYEHACVAARRGNTLYHAAGSDKLQMACLRRDYASLSLLRGQYYADAILSRLPPEERSRFGSLKFEDQKRWVGERIRVVDVLNFILTVNSIFVEHLLKADMVTRLDGRGQPEKVADVVNKLTFRGPNPDPLARELFARYVRAKWPLRVFAVDPVSEQQNELDSAARRDGSRFSFQLGRLGVGGDGSVQRVDARERKALRLNPTILGFTSGDDTFGWRFYPRVQAAGMFRRAPKIEPGQRECVALVVMPDFVPEVKFTTDATWIEDWSTILEPRAMSFPDQTFRHKVELSRRLKTAGEMMDRVGNWGDYPPETRKLLEARLHRIGAALPSRTFTKGLPYELNSNGSGIFHSRWGRLGPMLLTWHGTIPPRPDRATSPATILVEGKSFSVHDTRVVVGGAVAEFELLSRTVMAVKIPKEAQVSCPDSDRPFLEVQVATPNGISNPLMVEVRNDPRDHAPTDPLLMPAGGPRREGSREEIPRLSPPPESKHDRPKT